MLLIKGTRSRNAGRDGGCDATWFALMPRKYCEISFAFAWWHRNRDGW